MNEFRTIVYEAERGRARITLNRPEKRNALSFELMTELHEALWEADDDTSVHAVILRGAGRSFSARAWTARRSVTTRGAWVD